MKNHSENLFTRALVLTIAMSVGACAPDQPAVKSETPPPAALHDQSALTSRTFRPVKIDLARAEKLGRLAAVHPELARPLIQQIRTTKTQVCAGERLMVDAEANGEPGVEVRVQGQRAMPALVAFHATGERTVRVVARQHQNGKLVAIDRQEVPVTVVDCPNAPLVDLLTQPGETSDTVVVRVTRVQGLAGGERVEEKLLEGLHYRYDFGDGAVVVSDQPTASHRYLLAGQRRATTYVQVTAIDGAGKEAVGRRAHDAREEPDGAPKIAAATESAEIIGARMRAHQEAMENNPWLDAAIEKARAQANATP